MYVHLSILFRLFPRHPALWHWYRLQPDPRAATHAPRRLYDPGTRIACGIRGLGVSWLLPALPSGGWAVLRPNGQ